MAGPTGGVKKRRIPKPKPKATTKTTNKNNISFGQALQINKDRQVTKQFDEKKKKKKGPGLKEVLSAAASLTSGGGGGGSGVSATSQSYGGGNVPTGYTAEDFWHPETTESGSPNDNG